MKDDIRIEIVDLVQAADACARITGHKPKHLVPDDVVERLEDLDWKPVDWQRKSDTEIALRTGIYGAGLEGPLLVVTDASFHPGLGRFRDRRRQSRALVTRHRALYGENFSGDVIVIEREGRKIWILHHEGVYTTVSGASDGL